MTTKGEEMDSPRSWLILACSFACIFLVSLIITSMGILQAVMIEDLEVGSGVISIMTSVALGGQSLLGPLSGAVSSVLSMRCTIFLGILCLSFGQLFASFAYSLPSLICCFILIGTGTGLSFTPCIVVVSHHFEKKRMLANSIALCAPGVASMVLPYLHLYLIDTSGWRYCIAINGALMLHALVCASFFIPTAGERKGMLKFSSCFLIKSDDTKYFDAVEAVSLQHDYSVEACDKMKHGHYNFEKENNTQIILTGEDEKAFRQTLNSNLLGKTVISTEITDDIVYSNQEDKTCSLLKYNNDNQHTPLIIDSIDKQFKAESDKNFSKSLSELNKTNLSDSDTSSLDLTLTQSKLLACRHHKEASSQLLQTNKNGSLFASNLEFAGSEMGSCFIVTTSDERKNQQDAADVDQSLKAKMTRVIQRKSVWILCLSCFMYLGGCSLHLIHFPSYVISKGMPASQISYFYTVYGIVMVVGRSLGGVVYNRLKPPLLPLLFSHQILTGVTLGLAPFYATQPPGVCVMEFGFGIFYGHGFMIMAPIATQIVGVHDLGIAFGLFQLFNGIGLIAAPILMGFIYDITGTYDIPMYMAGSFCVVGALVLTLLVAFPDKPRLSQDQEQGTRSDTG